MDNLTPVTENEIQELIELNLIKFEKTYATIQEADDYINNYIIKDARTEKWNSLSNEDKARALRQSTQSLDGLRYKGVKKSDSQSLEFPRKKVCGFVMAIPRYYQSQDYDNGYLGGLNNSNEDGSRDITKACIENALDSLYFLESALSRRDIELQNISRQKIGMNDTSFISPKESVNNSLISAGIYSPRVKSILKNWLSDSRFSTC